MSFIREDSKYQLDDLEIPWNAKFLLVNSSDHQITDVYQIGKNTGKIYSHFATWNKSNLEARPENFYSSRMELKGHELKIIIPTVSFVFIIDNNC